MTTPAGLAKYMAHCEALEALVHREDLQWDVLQLIDAVKSYANSLLKIELQQLDELANFLKEKRT